MARFHINPKTGNPGLCRAKKTCPFGDLTEDHYETKELAQQAFEKKMQKDSLPTLTKAPTPTSLFEVELLDKVDEMEFEMIEEFANTSPQNHALLDRIIDTRAAAAVEWGEKLALLDPTRNKESACDRETYTGLKRDFDAFKNKTASLVEAHLESKFYKPKSLELENEDAVGHAIATSKFDPGTKEWLQARFDSVGGSDVGALVTMDFLDEEKVMYWDRKTLEKIEDAKVNPMTPEQIEKSQWLSRGYRGGPLYRGTVWEDRSRDKFVEDHPEMTVYNTKNQYYNPDRPWQQVNFDGILSDREDGQPNGVLELKTGNDPAKWDNGVPLNYRAQVLYYLNSTKLDYAIVGATINDGEQRYFRLNRNDPVAPGKYDKSMEDYINERVTPWFSELQGKRAA